MEGSNLLDVLAVGETIAAPHAGLRTFAANQQRRGEYAVADAATSFWHEMHVELRRQAGNERLPAGLRGTLRQLAHRAAARDTRQSSARLLRFPRRLLRTAAPAGLLQAQQAQARERMAAAGIDPEAPLALVEVRNRPDVLLEACALLHARGLTVVTIGHRFPPSLRSPRVVELGMDVEPIVELGLLTRSQLTICAGWDRQFTAALFGRPLVTLNATEPFRMYPVMPNGVFLLRTALEPGSGRELSLDEWLTESYFRNLRHHAHREHAAADVTAAVAETLDALDGIATESDAQAGVRARLTAAGERLAASTRHVMTWGPDEGFLGDGRLARVQAARLS